MCSTPLTFDGYEVSCRECDQCCATYKNTWVSRCVAEKITYPHALAFTLTYANGPDASPPLGSKVFRYRDVSLMWKRLRRAGVKRWGKSFTLRYVVVGERGTRFGRCHYHGVMFSNFPVQELGTFSNSEGECKFQQKTRLNWTAWGHGFCDFQKADRKGMSYVLKYILKSRMTGARSVGFGREGKTEWLASSYLWCSKVPSIGFDWLMANLMQQFQVGMCPASLRIRVPNGGDWYLTGKVQMLACLFIHDANNAWRAEHGRDLAGFKSLVESVAEPIELSHTGEIVNRKPWEYLINGKIEESEPIEPDADDVADLERHINARSDAFDTTGRAGRCFGVKACRACQSSRTAREAADDEVCEQLYREQYERERKKSLLSYKIEPFRTWITRQGLVAQGCILLKTGSEALYDESRDYQRRAQIARNLQVTSRRG